MKPHQTTIPVGTARCAVHATERSVRWRNVTREWPNEFRRLTLRSATGTSQRDVPTTLLVLLFTALSLSTGFCGKAKVLESRELSATPTNRPVVVYVTDFELHAADIKSEKGLLPPPPKLPGPLGSLKPPGTPKDPEKLATELVDGMSEALCKSLAKAGFTARYLASTNQLPTNGWLVRGVFTEVNQGNQMQRAVIGFGLGKTDLQVVVDIADLAQGPPRSFYEVKTDANSGKLPGAGPMIALNPAVGAARFVIASGDLKRNVKQTAAKIAGEVLERTKLNQPVPTAETQRR